MRIVYIFLIFATVTVIAYAFSMLDSMVRYIASLDPGLTDAYRKTYDAVGYGAIVAAVFTAMSVFAVIGLVYLVRWIGEIISE